VDGDLKNHELGTAPLRSGRSGPSLLRISRDSGWHGRWALSSKWSPMRSAPCRTITTARIGLVAQLDGRPPAETSAAQLGSHQGRVIETARHRTRDQNTGPSKIRKSARSSRFTRHPAAKPEELKPANGFPKHETYLTGQSFARRQWRHALLGAESNQSPKRDDPPVAWNLRLVRRQAITSSAIIIVNARCSPPTPGRFIAQ